MKDEKNKRDKYLLLVGILLCISLLIGVSFSYYRATENLVNETGTKIETNTLGLLFKGDKEINYQSMIPGDLFEKTFEVENTSNTAVTYNIYMQGITNEYNEDLVYTLYETDSNGANPVSVVSETTLPETNNDKWYLKTNISINSAPTKKYYKLVIEYKYLANQPQNDYQGSVFNATLGIDTIQNASNPQPASVGFNPIYYAFPYYSNGVWIDQLSTSSSTIPPEGRKTFLAMDSEGNKGLCIIKNGIKHCFQTGETTAQIEENHFLEVFSDDGDSCYYNDEDEVWYCNSEELSCSIWDGNINCRVAPTYYVCEASATLDTIQCSN